jgi:hypothetical protein
LEAVEDRDDVKTVKRTLAEMRRKGEQPIPWEAAQQQLGLNS